MISVHGDFDAVKRDLERLATLPGPGRALLDAALRAAFEDTQASVHVKTESLKRSGKEKSEEEHGTWKGSISYGGSSPGSVHEYVDYANYERDRGEAHDYLRNWTLHYSSFEEAVIRILKGEGIPNG